MRMPRLKRPPLQALGLLCLATAVIVGLGLVPGRLDGIYAGPACFCDCSNYTVLKDGRVIMYSTGHSPAGYLGTYEVSNNGAAGLYLPPFHQGEGQELAFRLKPKLFFLILEDPDNGETEWMWRRPATTSVRRLIRDEEIKAIQMASRNVMRTTYYDHNFRVIRVEDKEVKKAEQ